MLQLEEASSTHSKFETDSNDEVLAIDILPSSQHESPGYTRRQKSSNKEDTKEDLEEEKYTNDEDKEENKAHEERPSTPHILIREEVLWEAWISMIDFCI